MNKLMPSMPAKPINSKFEVYAKCQCLSTGKQLELQHDASLTVFNPHNEVSGCNVQHAIYSKY